MFGLPIFRALAGKRAARMRNLNKSDFREEKTLHIGDIYRRIT